MASLYETLGGAPAVRVAVDDFYSRVVGDPTLAPYFEDVDLDRVKAHQRAFLGAALGGPEGYDGRGMRTAHASVGVTGPAFDRVVDHLGATLESLEVPAETRGQVLSALAPLRDDIVTA